MNNVKRFFCAFLAAGLVAASASPAAAGVLKFPDVAYRMTKASFWSGRIDGADEVLATYSQIKKLNKAILAEPAANMFDLKNIQTTIDGKAMNEALYNDAVNSAAYFGLNKYDANGEKLTESYYESMIANTQSKNTDFHDVRYGIAVNRTTIRVFPTDLPILDDPGDDDFDNLYNSGLRVNEPFIIKSVSADGNYYFGMSDCCSGWVPAEDVAVCSSRWEWLDAWDLDNDEVLVVYGSKLRTESSNTTPETAERLLTMGTTLELVDGGLSSKLIGNRSAYNNYAVYLPVRLSDGSYRKRAALISQSAPVHEGFLPLTQENVMSVAFERLGDAYGWGGMLNADDCSGYVRDIYRCFGLNIARNTTWQSSSPVKKYTLTGLSGDAKVQIIKNLPIGSTLFFPGHEMTYLGTAKGKVYVISSTSSMMNPKKEGERLRVRGVVINTLDIKRANGKTWLESLSAATIPFAGAESALYERSYVGDGFADALDKTEVTELDASGKKLTVKWTPVAEGSVIEGYQIQYAYTDDFKDAGKVNVKDAKASSYTLKDIKKGKTCYARIRNYVTVDAKKYYSGWSEIKSVN